jgi:DNA-binding transcriptional MerR regulator
VEYKISELVAKTNVPKSTILYYIKEGLLPEAKKLKSNVHRYNDEHVELIRYIKYMQQEMGSSIEQIRNMLQQKNQSFSSSFRMLAPLMQTLSGIAAGDTHYTKAHFLEHYGFDAGELDTLLEEGVLMPIGEDDYTDREASIVRLVEDFSEVGVDHDILKRYVYHAKALADLESQIQIKLCDRRNEDNFSRLWKVMFDTLFNAKQYLFSRYTYRAMLRTLKEEVSQQKPV